MHSGGAQFTFVPVIVDSFNKTGYDENYYIKPNKPILKNLESWEIYFTSSR